MNPVFQAHTTDQLMRAARFYGKEDIRIKDDVPRPRVSDGQVLIEPAFVGICGTDLHEYLGGPNFAPKTPHPITQEQIPITLGHEFSGTIKEVGRGVDHLTPGQKVAVPPTIFCGSCAACKAGAENACPNGGIIGLSGCGGGLSEAVVAPGPQCVALPDDMGLDIGALVEPLAIAWHALEESMIGEISEPKCVVFGGGPIGLALILVLLARGVKPVICVEIAQKRQEFAKEFGAHHVIDPTKQDAIRQCREICGGESGPDIAFDCAGVPATIEAACKTVRPRGQVVNVAIWEKPVPFNPNWLVFREASYKAVLGHQKRDFEGVVAELQKGTLQPQGMITAKILMQNLVRDGFEKLISEKDRHVKILVDVQASM